MNGKIKMQSKIEEVDYKDRMLSFIKRYKANGRSITVNFRKLVSKLPQTERFTHLVHPYPAKLLPHIPYFFINNSYFTKKGNRVLDPFCGSGTVLLEALLSGRHAYGADANPLARLITSVKVSHLDEKKLKKNLEKILNESEQCRDATIPEIRNGDYWFSESNLRKLATLKRVIEKIRDEQVRNFFTLSLSNVARKVSFADPRISVPVRINPLRFKKGTDRSLRLVKRMSELEDADVFGKFRQISQDNIRRASRLALEYKDVDCEVIASDARYLTRSLFSSERMPKNSVDLILTSPPYAGAQKYIRASSMNLGMIDQGSSERLRELESQNIGRESFRNSEGVCFETGVAKADRIIKELLDEGKVVRAKIVSTYLREMREAIEESVRVLKSGGYFVMIVGNNKVAGREFETQDYLSNYLRSAGLTLELKMIDDIKSFGLMTKRNKTADIISREWILVFRKR